MEDKRDMLHEVVEDTEDFEEDEYIDNNKLMAYDIAVFYNTYNLSTLMKWWGKKLIVPEFQRSYVWNKKKASEFVDSVLRGLPVPTMFFYEDSDNARLLVVDGQQRLRSLHAFICEQSFQGKPFKLTGNIHPNWVGKTYDELDEEDRDRLDDALLNITVMRQLAPDDGQSSMYLAFQRINTGGTNLNAQEIRTAVSYGGLSKLLNELSRKEEFENYKFLRTNAQRENGDYSKVQEFILKFLTYYFSYPNFSGSSTRGMLDDFFDNQKDFDNPKRRKPLVKYYSEDEIKGVFYAAFEELCSLTTKDFSPYSKPAQTFMEAIWVGLTYRKNNLKKGINIKELPQYIANWKNVLGEEKFSELFQARRSSSVQSAEDRINAAIDYFSGDF